MGVIGNSYDEEFEAAMETARISQAFHIDTSSQTENKWISVDDELPKDAKPVIIGGGCGHYSHKYKRWYTNMERDHFGEYLPIQWTVTHWMPLPTPPKTEED